MNLFYEFRVAGFHNKYLQEYFVDDFWFEKWMGMPEGIDYIDKKCYFLVTI